MKSRYSIFSLARNALNYHKDWEKVWRSPDPFATVAPAVAARFREA